MNILRAFLFISTCIIFINCSDDDNRKKEIQHIFSTSTLKQTEWKGEILYLTNGEVNTKGSVNIVFYTESTGVCEYKFDYYIDPEMSDFKYEVQDKFIHFTGAILTGKWILQKYDGDSLVIADNKAAFTNSDILKLKRVN